jgi:AcrR family transcriptional regulator
VQVLEAVMIVFWEKGYQGTSMSDLTKVTGLTKPSLYTAFGNKEALYLASLERYQREYLAQHAKVLVADIDLMSALRQFLCSVAEMVSAAENPGGCMVVNSIVAAETDNLPEKINAAIQQTIRTSAYDLLLRRLQQANLQGELQSTARLENLAAFLAAFMAGMAIMAKAGVTENVLIASIDQALMAIPRTTDITS